MNSPWQRTRAGLQSRIIKLFSAQEEVYQIHFFGKEVRGKEDCYSDIDMVVCTSDLIKTRNKYRELFASIASIRATLPLSSDADGYAEMIMLEGYSPYQKIDFSFQRDVEDKAWVGPFLTIYDDPSKRTPNQSRLPGLPIKKDVAYKLNDVLFSVARFTKCLFREDIDMYRRWNSITGVTLAMLYEKHFDWEVETLRKGLAGFETERLYQVLDASEREQVDRIFSPQAKLDLTSSYQASINLFVELSKNKAAYFGVDLDRALIEYIMSFMDSEIARYHQQNF